ncbi:hypothetical protein BXZ70DRAFT_610545 [Cristinia sonorae]|uniref:Uncharacterized protein n=1 Tax=Cristinia sonorae TaxID=1940300 RepID=A0A8K0UUJ0_9AGAR|nr:hypothetical protein BXZ70DRAFT_610545 [Cristinia sonorae]
MGAGAAYEILEEGYLVQNTGINPSTGEPWKPQWVLKHKCSEDSIARWKVKKYQHGIIPKSEPLLTASNEDDGWGNLDMVLSSAPESSSRKRSHAESWGWDDIKAEQSEGDLGGQSLGWTPPPQVQMAKRSRPTDPGTRRPSYGPLSTGFKAGSSKKRTGTREPSSFNDSWTNSSTLETYSRPPQRCEEDIKPAPTEVTSRWLLLPLARTNGITVEIKHSFPENENPGWNNGDFEGLQGVVLSVLNLGDGLARSTATVRLANPPDEDHRDYPIPVDCLWPVPPSKAGELAIILVGQFCGQVAKLRQLEEEGVWLVSAGNSHFEIEAEHMAGLVEV